MEGFSLMETPIEKRDRGVVAGAGAEVEEALQRVGLDVVSG